MSSKWLLSKGRGWNNVHFSHRLNAGSGVHPVAQTKQLLLKLAKLMWAGNILLFSPQFRCLAWGCCTFTAPLSKQLWEWALLVWCWMWGVATALWGCSRYPTPVVNQEVPAGKILKRKAGRGCAAVNHSTHCTIVKLRWKSIHLKRKGSLFPLS